MRDLSFDIRARDRTQAGFDQAERNALRFNGALDSIGRNMGLIGLAVKGFAIGFAMEGVRGFASAMRDAVADAADLVDMSKRVGVSTEDLQRMQFGFAQAGVAATDVDQILTQWAKRIGEAKIKGGELADLLRANGVSLTDGNGKLRSSVDLMGDYAELIKNARSDQERTVLATMAFGKAGAAMVLALEGGKAGFHDIMEEADAAGGVIEDEVLKQAAKLDDQFNAIAKTIDTRLKTALVGTAAVIGTMQEKMSDMEKTMAQVGNSGFFHSAAQWLGAIDENGKVNPSSGLFPPESSADERRLLQEKRDIQREIEQSTLREKNAQENGFKVDPAYGDQIKQWQQELALIDQQLKVYQTKKEVTAAPFPVGERDWHKPARPTVIPNGEVAKVDPWGNTREVNQQRLAVLELIASLEAEAGMIGKSDQARRAANASRLAGSAATTEERKRIIALNESLYLEQKAREDAIDANGRGRDMLQGIIGDLKDGTLNGKTFWETMGNAGMGVMGKLASRWEDMVAEMIFPATGGKGAFDLASLFGGGKKAGAGAFAETGGGLLGMIGGGMNDNYAKGAVTRAPLGNVLAASRSAIRSIESDGSGGYGALGPVLKNGNQALGAYQVMSSNLPSWSKEAFGRSMSPNEFLSNPAAQDRIFDQQFGKSLSKYGNPQDAASVWFTGRPQSEASRAATDVLGTSGGKYVDKFNAALGDLDKTTTGATKTVAGMGANAAAATKDLGLFGGGVGELGKALSSIGGGSGGNGWFSNMISMFNGVGGATSFMNGISPAATSFLAGGGVGLFAEGGVSDRPAIFGEAGAEAAVPLTRGRRIPVELRSPPVNNNGSGAVHVTIGWSRTADGNLKPFVENVAQKKAGGVVRAGIEQYDKGFSSRLGEALERNG